MKPEVSQSRDIIISAEEKASIKNGGLFLSPLLHLIKMEKSFVPDERRKRFQDSPPWFLFFKGRFQRQAEHFVFDTITAMDLHKRYLGDGAMRIFHNDTGKIAMELVSYMKNAQNTVEEILKFLQATRAFASGKRKSLPRPLQVNDDLYKDIKALLESDYRKRLTNEFKEGCELNKSQDFIFLFKAPLYSLLDAIFWCDSDDEVLQVIDNYR